MSRIYVYLFIGLFVCLSVCLSARITRKPHGRTVPNSLACMARSSMTALYADDVMASRSDPLRLSNKIQKPLEYTT